MPRSPSRLPGLTPAQHDALDRLFTAEIEGRDIQLHPRTAKALIEKGLAGRYWRRDLTEIQLLTHRGRLLICQWCTGRKSA